jgi:putative ABC transport system permease protein
MALQMRSVRATISRIRRWATGRDDDRQLAAELESHLALHVDDNIRHGMSPADARRDALLKLGGLDQTKERYRDRRTLPILDTLARDARDAWRHIRRTPRVSAIIVFMLAAALGLNAAAFAITDALLIRPFAFPNVDRVVVIEETRPQWPWRGLTAPATFVDWKRSARTLMALSAASLRDVEIGGGAEPERLRAALVSADFFNVTGMTPPVGRGFLPDEETIGRHRSVVLGDDIWTRLFDADPRAIGRVIVLDGVPYQIVGVAPKDFSFPFGSQLWLPAAFSASELDRRDARTVLAFGRLADGASIAAAEAELEAITGQLGRQFPEAMDDSGVRVRTVARGLAEEGSDILHAFVHTAALFVLLIACANVANLILADAAARQREIAVRFALGATRAQIVRAFWIETCGLALLAVPIAIAVARAGLGVIVSRLPAQIAPFLPGWNTIDVDGRLVAFTTILAVVATGAFGLFPALRASQPDGDALKEAARGLTAGAGPQRVRRGLIVVQVALVLPLLVSAVAFSRGTARFLNGPQGYDPEGLLTLRLALPERQYPDSADRTQFISDILDAVHVTPDVRSAAAANFLPSSGANFTRPIAVEGRPPATLRSEHEVEHRVISSGYLETMGIRLVGGRAFDGGDRAETTPVGIVSRSMADRFWPGQDPVGGRVRYEDQPGSPWITVVGVAGNVIEDWYWGRDQLTLYRPYAQEPPETIALVVRTHGNPAAATTALRHAVRSVDSSRPILDVATMRQVLADRLNGPRTVSFILGTLGALALVLSALGLYSVISFLVSQRTHEIGLRLALGATPAEILRSVLVETARLGAAGLAVGAALAVGLTRMSGGFFAGIAASGYPLILVLAATVGAMTIVAGFWPARRAATIEPSIALRQQ